MFWRQVVASETGENDVRMAIVQEQSQMLDAGLSFSGFERDMVALSRGDGTFLDVSGVSGADSITDGRAAVYADFDNDGDVDIFLTAMHGPAHLLYRNEIGQDRGFIRIALVGSSGGRDGFGAVVRVKTSHGIQTQSKDGGSGFLSQRDPRLLFGLGDDAGVEWIEVSWPNGESQRFGGAKAGASLVLTEGSPKMVRAKEKAFSLPDPYEGLAGRWDAVSVRPGALLAVTEDVAPHVGGGRQTLLNFWATWCSSCAIELPELQRIHAANPEGVRIVGLSIDEPEAHAAIPDYVKQKALTFPILIAKPKLLETIFSADDISVPFSILLDGDGRVVDIFAGWNKATRQRLHTALETK